MEASSPNDKADAEEAEDDNAYNDKGNIIILSKNELSKLKCGLPQESQFEVANCFLICCSSENNIDGISLWNYNFASFSKCQLL